MDLRIIHPREIISKYDLKLIEHVDGWHYYYSDYDCRDSLRKIRLCVYCEDVSKWPCVYCEDVSKWHLNIWFDNEWQEFKVNTMEDIELICLAKQAAKRQLIADTIQQGQSLITSSINIIKGFSSIPVVGLPLGIAAVGTLLAFFAKTKADAFKATKLYTGAEKISDHFGYGQKFGDSDLNGGSGYRLINERSGKPTNVIISGNEMLLPERISRENETFFNSLRAGYYNGLNLDEAVMFYKEHKGFEKRLGGSSTIVNNITTVKSQAVKKERAWIPFKSKDGRSMAILKTISEDMKDGSIIELDF